MAHPDLDELLNSLLPFAQQMLAKSGEFFPFGAGMKLDGEIVAVGVYVSDERPLSQNLIDLLTKGFRQQANTKELWVLASVMTFARFRPDRPKSVMLSALVWNINRAKLLMYMSPMQRVGLPRFDTEKYLPHAALHSSLSKVLVCPNPRIQPTRYARLALG